MFYSDFVHSSRINRENSMSPLPKTSQALQSKLLENIKSTKRKLYSDKLLESPFSAKKAKTETEISQQVKETVSELKKSQTEKVAKKLDFDVFNALDLMENVEFLEKLKFGIGDGNLQYYIYNWRSPQMTSKEVGLVLQ